jgi:hypothetical protein
MGARRSKLKTLFDVIGGENDLAEFHIAMDEAALFDDATRDRFRGVITGRRAELHRHGRPLGERLFAEPPDRIVDRLRVYWRATREYKPA